MSDVPSGQVIEALEKCQLLDSAQVIKLLHVSRSTLNAITFRKENPVPSVLIGRARRYPFEKVRWWMENLKK